MPGLRDGNTIRSFEALVVGVVPGNREATLVHQRVMPGAEQLQILRYANN